MWLAVLLCSLPLSPLLNAHPQQTPLRYQAETVARYPHNPDYFTQGLLIDEGILYESTGLRGHSALRQLNLKKGTVYREHKLDERIFGEGIALLDDEIYQLSWKAGVGYVYDKHTLTLKRLFHYRGEGWGITNNEQQLIMSNGSAELQFKDPKQFITQRSIQVHINGERQRGLNELEYINGKIYANQWKHNHILEIDPANGAVTAIIDLSHLVRDIAPKKGQVLNGIAYDRDTQQLYVTGKQWPYLFEIRLPDSALKHHR